MLVRVQHAGFVRDGFASFSFLSVYVVVDLCSWLRVCVVLFGRLFTFRFVCALWTLAVCVCWFVCVYDLILLAVCFGAGLDWLFILQACYYCLLCYR